MTTQSAPTKQPLVLIVEDDILVLMDTAEAIRRAGYRVLEAGNADQAIRLLEKHADIEVLFTDIEMPGSMDGLRLAHAVKDRWPPVKIVSTSAYLEFHSSHLPDGGRFFPKPYSVKQIAEVLSELTAKPR